jgi:hypothetical protein
MGPGLRELRRRGGDEREQDRQRAHQRSLASVESISSDAVMTRLFIS